MFSSTALSQLRGVELQKFPVEDLQEDFRFWRKRLERKHPLLYLYNSRIEVDRMLDSVYQQIDHPMDELEFYTLLVPLTARIRDGHNSIFPSLPTINELRDNDYLFPLEVTFINKRLYVKQNYSDCKALKPGAEILSIKNVKSEELYDSLISKIPRDGYNVKFAENTLNSIFRFYYHLYYGLHEEYMIEFKDEKGNARHQVILGHNLNFIKHVRAQRYGKGEVKKAVEYQNLDSLNTGLLKISTFDIATIKKGSKQKFKKEIRQAFQAINDENVSNLIIDLRDNGGGNPDYVKFVLQRLFTHPFEQGMDMRVVKDSKAASFDRRTKKKWVPGYGIGSFNPKKDAFSGDIYVLMDGGTFSAGVVMGSVLKKYNRAVFIGTETGGNPVIMSGYFVKMTWELPNTKIQVSPGTVCSSYQDMDKNKGKGLLPDHEILPSPEDLKQEQDRQLQFALKQIAFWNKRNTSRSE